MATDRIGQDPDNRTQDCFIHWACELISWVWQYEYGPKIGRVDLSIQFKNTHIFQLVYNAILYALNKITSIKPIANL